MSKKHRHPQDNKSQQAPTPKPEVEEAQAAEVVDDVLQGTEDDEQTALEDLANKELDEKNQLADELEKTKAELDKEKKEYLFLMAEFDNFRKRVLKEKADLIKNGAERALKGILPIVDDFERGLEATKDATDAEALRQGMELIYQKMVKYLTDNNVKAMDTDAGSDFDPELHEAIATVPNPDAKGKIIDTTQKGYTLNDDKVLRHAKVVVGG